MFLSGLSAQQAKALLSEYGENLLAQEKRTHPMRIFLGQFRDVMVLILLAATTISVLLGEISDAITIILIVLLNATLGFIQEFRTEKTLETLRGLTAPYANVCRDHYWQSIPAKLLVPGDYIRVTAGENIPADCAIVSADGLSLNESVLTGESEAVSKNAGSPQDTDNALHKKNILYAGTAVLRGEGTAVVIATGTHTQVGQISEMLREIETGLTPLQKRLDRLGKVVAIICIVVCIVVFLAGVFRGEPVFEMLMTGITIAIAAIPEGLPATVTIALALAVSRMMKRNALVNRLHSVETLGCASVICVDKTGTITENCMTVTTLFADGKCYPVTASDIPEAEHSKAVQKLLTCCVLCGTATLSPSGAATGDPTEIALLYAAQKVGIHREAYQKAYPQQAIEPFDSDSRKMRVTVLGENGQSVCYTKGAADRILEQCSQLLSDGQLLPMTAGQRNALLQQVSAMSSEALRVLAFAEDDVFLGLCGMIDPPRTSARNAIRVCTQAQIQTVMITGDHRNTAAAIAQQAGLLQGRKVMTGEELDAMSEAALADCITEYGVFARVNPAHKLRLVRAYQNNNRIVAMTGDGVNDAPAIKEADVGVAMGKGGTDVARQAADVVLLDDNLATLVYAVEQGRCIYANIRKFVRYLLSCNIGEVITMLLSILMGMPMVLLPTQLLLVNLVTDGLPAIALGLEPPEPELMRKPPRKPNESFFSGGLLFRIGFRGVLIGLCTLGAFSTVLGMHQSLEMARTAALCTLILSQLIHVFECKSETKSLFRIPYGNNWKLLGAVGISALVLVLCVCVPPLQVIFNTVSLNVGSWLAAIGYAAAVPLVSGFGSAFSQKSQVVEPYRQ